MAVTTWYKRVRESGELKVFPGPSFKGSPWTTALDGALTAFNDLMTRHGIKLTLSKGDKAIAAHIIVEAATDQASFSWDNVSYSKSFDGTGLHGLTVPLKDPKDGTRERVYVFVPAKPRIDITNKKSREAGRDVRIFILVHEFIHAAGPDNDEHTLEDVFCYPGEIVKGDTAAADRLKPWGGLGKEMPPYYLICKTVTNLRKAWPSTAEGERKTETK